MGSYSEGLRTGQGLTRDAFQFVGDYYDAKDKSYKRSVEEKAAASAAQKYQDEKDTEAFRYSDKTAREDRAEDERIRRDKAVESEYAPGSRGPRGAGKGSGMTDEQRKSVARRAIMADYARRQDKGEEIDPAFEESYNQAVLDEAKYLHPGQSTVPKKEEAPSKEEGGWGDTIRNAAKSAENFFKSSGVPAGPAGWKPRKAKLSDGRIVTETSPGVWPE